MTTTLKINGHNVLIDTEDYVKVKQYKWGIIKCKRRHDYYYVRTTRALNGSRNGKRILLHRLILDLVDSDKIVDHINHDRLDNRKSNLRIVTAAQNMQNRRSFRGSSSKYKGVHVTRRKKNKYRAEIRLNKKTVCLGSFDTETKAAKAYNEAAKKHFGEYACLNKV